MKQIANRSAIEVNSNVTADLSILTYPAARVLEVDFRALDAGIGGGIGGIGSIEYFRLNSAR